MFSDIVDRALVGMRLCIVGSANSIHLQRWVRWLAGRKQHDILLLSFLPFPPVYRDLGVATQSLVRNIGNGGESPTPTCSDNGRASSIRSVGALALSLLPRAAAQILDMEIYALRARRFVREFAPDVIQGCYLTHHGYIAARSGFTPLVLDAQGSDVLVHPIESQLFRMMARYAAAKASVTRCHAQELTVALAELGVPPERLVTFPWGTNLGVFKPLHGNKAVRDRLGWQGQKILVMTRSFEPIYGIEFLINALPMVLERYPEVRVILAGTGSMVRTLRQQVTKMGLCDFVHFAGMVREPELVEILNAADIYVSTSMSDGTSVSLLEAMACGLPTVVSDVPANLEWVTDGINGLVVPRRNPALLAARLVELLGDISARERMAKRNLEIVRAKGDFERNSIRLEAMLLAAAKDGQQKETDLHQRANARR